MSNKRLLASYSSDIIIAVFHHFLNSNLLEILTNGFFHSVFTCLQSAKLFAIQSFCGLLGIHYWLDCRLPLFVSVRIRPRSYQLTWIMWLIGFLKSNTPLTLFSICKSISFFSEDTAENLFTPRQVLWLVSSICSTGSCQAIRSFLHLRRLLQFLRKFLYLSISFVPEINIPILEAIHQSPLETYFCLLYCLRVSRT